MFGHFTRDERNILLAILGMMAAGFACQTYLTAPPRLPLPARAPGAFSAPSVNGTAPHNDIRRPVRTRTANSIETTASASRMARSADGRLDINRATARHFEELPGIGPSRAKDLVAWREANGRFQSVDQLDLVPGIGPATMARLLPLITVETPTTSSVNHDEGGVAQTSPKISPSPMATLPLKRAAAQAFIGTLPVAATRGRPDAALPPQPPESGRQSGLGSPAMPRYPRPSPVTDAPPAASFAVININTAGQQELESLDRIGPALARRIIEYRTRNGAFPTLESLVSVPGIGPKILERNRHRISVR